VTRGARLVIRAIAPVAILAQALLALGACAAVPSADSPKEYLDEATAATISVVGKPIVFARERPERAAHVRDYVTMAAATVNRGGRIDYIVIAYFWSTLDERGKASIAPASDSLIVAADDRRIRLALQGHSAHEAGIGTPVHAPPGRSATPNVYHTDLATLRFIAEARNLAILADADDSSSRYEVWDDHRAALRSLVQLLSGDK
jgi:hypothetical protein